MSASDESTTQKIPMSRLCGTNARIITVPWSLSSRLVVIANKNRGIANCPAKAAVRDTK
jgi:hypothetical protein